MAFWCLRLLPGKVVPYVPTIDEEPRIHISQACLTPDFQGENVYLMMKSGDYPEDAGDNDDDFVVFGVLSTTCQSAGLDLIVDGYTEFKITGNAEVHLTGYRMPDTISAEDDDDYDGEDLEQSMPEGMFGEEEDDEDDEDEHLENISMKNVKENKSCVIEEVDDEDQVAKNKQVNRKESKKRKKKQNKSQKVDELDEQQQDDGAGPSSKKLKASQSKETNLMKGQTRTFPSGLKIIQKQVGFDDAKQAVKGSTVRISYVLRLQQNQKIIDQSKSFKFKLGFGKVVAGMDDGCMGMRVGDERIIVCPPEMGYGAEGVKGSIPPNATLEFQVTLNHVK